MAYIYAENFATLEILAISRDVDEISKKVRPMDLERINTLTVADITGSPPVEDLCKYFYKELDNENLMTNDVNIVSMLKLNILNQEPEPAPLRSDL